MASTIQLLRLPLALALACAQRDGAASGDDAKARATSPVAGLFGASPKPAPLMSTPPTTELVTMRDPVENAYTLGMPKGWHNQTYSARVQDIHSMVATSTSPDGSVLIFSGDPSIPQYWSPAAATPIQRSMARTHPRMKIESFVRATSYFPGYVKRKFAGLPGFKLISTVADVDAEARLKQKFVSAGVRLEPTVANVEFSYHEGGKAMRGLVIGTTSDSGPFWIASVSGIATTGDPKAYVPMLEAMGRSHQMNADWQAEQNRQHQARMAQIADFGRRSTARHQQNMAALQQSAGRHQQRMKAIWAQGDASMKQFNDRMARGEAQQRSFLNAINEEHTVVSPSGKTYQVDHSYQRYFVNKQNGSYVGGDLRMDLGKLRTLGLRPDDYEEVKIKK